MRRTAIFRWRTCVCALLVCLAAQTLAPAQWYPYYGGNYPYGGWGGFGWNTTRRIHQQDRMAAQARAMQQEAMRESSIRAALEDDARMRNQTLLDDRRASRDWWTSVQDRQMAQRRVPAMQVSESAAPSPSQRDDRNDSNSLIQWPSLLRLPTFSAERQRIETPFARFAAGGTPVSVSEYETILAQTATMRQRLNTMTSQVIAADFLAAQQFLDRLDIEAKSRIAAASHSPGPPSPQ